MYEPGTSDKLLLLYIIRCICLRIATMSLPCRTSTMSHSLQIATVGFASLSSSLDSKLSLEICKQKRNYKTLQIITDSVIQLTICRPTALCCIHLLATSITFLFSSRHHLRNSHRTHRTLQGWFPLPPGQLPFSISGPQTPVSSRLGVSDEEIVCFELAARFQRTAPPARMHSAIPVEKLRTERKTWNGRRLRTDENFEPMETSNGRGLQT